MSIISFTALSIASRERGVGHMVSSKKWLPTEHRRKYEEELPLAKARRDLLIDKLVSAHIPELIANISLQKGGWALYPPDQPRLLRNGHWDPTVRLWVVKRESVDNGQRINSVSVNFWEDEYLRVAGQSITFGEYLKDNDHLQREKVAKGLEEAMINPQVLISRNSKENGC